MTFSPPLAGASPLNSNAVFGNNPMTGQPQPGGGFGGQAGFGAAVTPGTSPDASASSGQNQPTDSSSASSSSSATSPPPGQQPGATPGNALSGQTFGGMPVVGVVSTSKKEGIREFNHKRKYSEWQFIYDPASDRGGLLMTPNQPPLQGFGNQQLQPGQQGNTSGSPFGSSSSGFNNNSSGFNNNSGLPPQQAPPSNAPQQQ